jgi:uncharacterized protein HemY
LLYLIVRGHLAVIQVMGLVMVVGVDVLLLLVLGLLLGVLGRHLLGRVRSHAHLLHLRRLLLLLLLLLVLLLVVLLLLVLLLLLLLLWGRRLVVNRRRLHRLHARGTADHALIGIALLRGNPKLVEMLECRQIR